MRRQLAGDRAARAVRRRARGGRARARGVRATRSWSRRLRAVPGDAGDDERDRRASATRRSPTRSCATSSGTSASRPRRSTRDVADRVLSLPRAAELRDARGRSAWTARASGSARRISRRGAAAATDDAGRAGRRDDRRSPEPAAAAAARPGRDPLVHAARPSWRRRESLSCVRVEKGDDRGRVAPCGLTRSAASSSTSTGRSSTAGADFGARPLPGAREVLAAIRASGPAAGRCSRTAATSARRRSPRSCARSGCRSPTTRSLTPVVQRDRPTCAAATRASRSLVFALAGRRASAWRPRACRSSTTDARQAGAVFVAHVERRLARRHRARGPGGPRRRAAADRELRARRTAGADGPDLQPRRDGHRGAGQGRPARAPRSSASPRGRASTRSAAASACRRRRWRSSATTSAWTSRSATWAGRRPILVRSGMSGTVDLNDVPEKQRPHAVVDGVEQILGWL